MYIEGNTVQNHLKGGSPSGPGNQKQNNKSEQKEGERQEGVSQKKSRMNDNIDADVADLMSVIQMAWHEKHKGGRHVVPFQKKSGLLEKPLLDDR